jgi:methylenetetrahydrofolate dehydrogenase (NADP+)/methenyltetrahydrofolate cyclohydrolase
MSEIKGKLIAQKILDKVRERVQGLENKPSLAVLMVGNNQASAKYVSKKAQAAEYIGIKFFLNRYPENMRTGELIKEIERTQLSYDAVIVQLPLPRHIETQKVLDAIDPDKDSDCLSSTAIGRVMRGDTYIIPPTAAAVMEILAASRISLKGKHVVVVGQGDLVGKAIAAMMLNEPVTLTVCGIETKKLGNFTKTADILISGTGQANLIKAAMVKKGTVVIDAGISFVKGKIAGDVDYARVIKKAKLVTPTPGGVGPVTVAKLFENVLALAEK